MIFHPDRLGVIHGDNRAKHSGRQVKLTYMVIDNAEYEVIE